MDYFSPSMQPTPVSEPQHLGSPILQPTSVNTNNYANFSSTNSNNFMSNSFNSNVSRIDNSLSPNLMRDDLDNALENAQKTVQQLKEQKLKEEMRLLERANNQQPANFLSPPVAQTPVQDTDTDKLNEKLMTFLTNVESRLNLLENNVQKLRSEFQQTSNNQQKFNQEFLKAVVSLSNDIPKPSPLSNGVSANNSSLSVMSKNPSFSLSPLSSNANTNIKAQEESDSEIAKRLQDEFDKQQPVQYPNLVQQQREACPICNQSFEVKDLQAHVEGHLNEQQSNPSFLSKLFPPIQTNVKPQGDIRPPTYATPNPGYPMSIPPQHLRPPVQQPIRGQPVPMGSMPVYPVQMPPQGSIVYRQPPPNGQYSPQPFLSPDGTVVYAYPNQPPK